MSKRIDSGKPSYLRCPHCRGILLHDDMRITGTFAGAAEVVAECALCGHDVLFGYVDEWNLSTTPGERAAQRMAEDEEDVRRIMGEQS